MSAEMDRSRWRDALLDFNAEYAAAIDDDRLEEWPAFFSERCSYRVTTQANHSKGRPGALIHADSRAMLEDRVASLRQANVYERQRYRHLLGTPRVLAHRGATADVETPFLVARIVRDGGLDLFAAGKYLDRFASEGGRLLIDERLVVLDSSRIDTLLALPL